MSASVSSGLKTTLLLHALFAGILGVFYFAVPVRWGELVGWPPAQPLDHRVIGAAFLAFALASWLARGAGSWGEVRIVVAMHALFATLATLLLVWALLTADVPALGWVYVVIVGAFAVAFILAYRQHSSA